MEVSTARGCREGNSSPLSSARQGEKAVSVAQLEGLLICYKAFAFTR